MNDRINRVNQDLQKSKVSFLNLVLPKIIDKCGGGKIISVEDVKNEIASKLDIFAGIDFLQITNDGCRGILSRVQFGDKNWKTFTIRKERISGSKTEFEKRQTAILYNNGYIYPFLMCHAYMNIDGTQLLGGGLAKTIDVFNTINNNKYIIRNNPDKSGQATFFVINFCDVENCFVF